MKKVLLYVCVCFLAATLVSAQQKKGMPAGAGQSAAAKICADPYQVTEPADGWPEGPVTVLFHRENTKTPWSRNSAIRAPNLEAALPPSARTLVCVEESRVEMGRYESGEPGYAPSWDVTLLRLADRKVYFSRGGFYGEQPPEIKFNRGAGVGKPPTEAFVRWLRLIVEQKVARLKMRLKLKEYHEVSAMAFSADGSKLVITQEPRSTLDGTPPTPFTVFDLATAKPVATWHTDYLVRSVAISKSGNMVAMDRYGHVEIWDTASARLVHKLDTTGVESLVFGPDDTLAAAGSDNAALWDVSSQRVLRSAKGSRLVLSPEGAWLVVKKDASGITVQALESGSTLAAFPPVSEQQKYHVSGDGKSMAKSSLFGATMYLAGNSEGHSLTLPAIGVGSISAVAPTRDGFVVASRDGVVGIASASRPELRVFATDHSSISAIAVSPDNRLVALGDSSGHVSVWELR